MSERLSVLLNGSLIMLGIMLLAWGLFRLITKS